MTTAPTYSAWNTRNVVSEKNSVQSVSSLPKRRSGLSEPYFAMASAYVMRGNGVGRSTPIVFHTALAIDSPSSMTSSCSTKLISMSSCVNSG